MRFKNSSAVLAQGAIPRLEDYPEVLSAREAQAAAAAELTKARNAVTTLETELQDPKGTRSELRVRLEIEEAQAVVHDRQVAFNQTNAAVHAIEDRIRETVIRPALDAEIESAVRDFYPVILEAAAKNERIRQAEALARELLGVHVIGFSLAWPELLSNASQSTRIQTYADLAVRERGISL